VGLDNQRELEFGKEHLRGTRAIVDIRLAKPGAEKNSFLQQTVAIYLCWQQAFAFFLNPADQSLIVNNSCRAYRRCGVNTMPLLVMAVRSCCY
jgi:hypothetical protein